MKKNSFKYNENNPSDAFDDAIDIDTGEAARSKSKEKVSDAYWEILHWAEDRRKKKFMAITVKKQFKAFKIARESGIMPHQLKARWREFEDDAFRQKIGWDWMDVVLSFNKKPQ